MTDKAYTHGQIRQIEDNIKTASDRLDTLAKSTSRFGELEAYPFGALTLIPCGKVPADPEGMRINESMRLLLDDALVTLKQFVECQQEDPQDNSTENEECEELFTLIEGLDIEVDYNRIKTDITTAKNETVIKIDNNGTKIDNLTAIAESSSMKIEEVAIKTDGIWNQINAITLAVNGIRADIGEIDEGVKQLLECPCDANIINAIRDYLDLLRNDINISLNEISNNIDVDGANVNIDYEPIFKRIESLRNFVSVENTNINQNINFHSDILHELITRKNDSVYDRVVANTEAIYNELTSCCQKILGDLNNLKFDLTPILQAIANSEQKILTAFTISENKIITNIADAKTEILSGQTEIENVILAKIEAYLNRTYTGTITVQDKDKNEYKFPFNGLGLDGIHNTILSMVEAMEALNNQRGDPCHSVALIYSERYPAHVLEDQLEIVFIEEGTQWKSDSNDKRVTIHNPRENLDFCTDIYPLAIERGNKVYGRMEWNYAKPDLNGDLRFHKSYTGGRFRSETDAIAFLDAIGKLSKIPPKPPRVTTNTKYKTVVAAKRFRPVRAVLTRFAEDGETVLEKRCLEAPPEGC